MEITLDPEGKDEAVSMVSTSILCIPGAQILRLFCSVHIVVTGRDRVSGGGIDGSKVITAKDQGSNRRATAAASSASIPVHSRNSV